MEISEQGYEVGTPSKTTAREDVDRASYVSKRKGGKPASPTNPKKGSAGKRKKKIQYIQAIGRPKKNMKDIQAIVQTVKNMLFAWPRTLLRGV